MRLGRRLVARDERISFSGTWAFQVTRAGVVQSGSPERQSINDRPPRRLGSLRWPRYDREVLPSSGASSFWYFTLIALAVGCSDAKPDCDENVADIGGCDRSYDADICATPRGRCVVACSARASCSELTATDVDMTPAWLARCWSRCTDVFECPDGSRIAAYWKCDGDEDCVGGADERGCSYFTCASGEVISSEAACDEYAECADGSDEQSCEEDS